MLLQCACTRFYCLYALIICFMRIFRTRISCTMKAYVCCPFDVRPCVMSIEAADRKIKCPHSRSHLCCSPISPHNAHMCFKVRARVHGWCWPIEIIDLVLLAVWPWTRQRKGTRPPSSTCASRRRYSARRVSIEYWFIFWLTFKASSDFIFIFFIRVPFVPKLRFDSSKGS